MHTRLNLLPALSMLALLASACAASTQAAPAIIVSSTPIAGFGGDTSTPPPSPAVVPATGGTTTPTPLPPSPTPPPTQGYVYGVVPSPRALPTAPLEVLVIEIKVAMNPQYGDILVDGKGRTLYLYTGDNPRVSTCYDACAQMWPPAVPYGRKPTALPGIDPLKLKSFVRPDGTMQVTYNDWPLYYYSGDTAPGQTNGQGSGGKWFVVSVNGDPVK